MPNVALYLVVITLIAGLTPIGARMAVAEIPPMTLALVRFATAGALLWITLRIRGMPMGVRRGDLWKLAALAVVCVPINQFGFLRGIKLANASHASLCYAVVPVMVFWLSLTVRREAYSGRMLLATLLAGAGALCVLWPSFDWNGPSATGGSDMLEGDALLLLAAFSWSVFVVASKQLIETYGALRTLAWVFTLGAILHVPIAFTDVAKFDAARLTWRGVSGWLFITVVTSYLNYLLIYIVLTRSGATRAMVVVNGAFVITALVEWSAFNEPLTAYFAGGCVLIAGAIGAGAVASPARGAASPATIDHGA